MHSEIREKKLNRTISEVVGLGRLLSILRTVGKPLIRKWLIIYLVSGDDVDDGFIELAIR